MRRPAWAAAGSFTEAWRYTDWAARESSVAVHRELGRAVQIGLGRANVITVDRAQSEALPDPNGTYEESAKAFCDLRLPFDPLFLSTGGASLDRFDPPAEFLGALITTTGPGQMLEDGVLNGEWDGRQILIYPFVGLGGHGGVSVRTVMDAVVFPGPSGWNRFGVMEVIEDELLASGVTVPEIEQGKTMAADAAHLACRVLVFLNSINVELVESEVSRQERRAVQRSGGRISLTVQVRKSRRAPSQGEVQRARKYSHRFETRGHYKHHFELKPDSTPNKVFERYATLHPEKVLTIEGNRAATRASSRHARPACTSRPSSTPKTLALCFIRASRPLWHRRSEATET